MIVGLYGYVGSGKSSVSRYLESKGWNRIDQDILGHEVLLEHSIELADLFGTDILINDKVDRKILGQKVFSNPILREQLMSFTYPLIIEKTKKLIRKYTVIEGVFFCKIKEHIPHDELWYVFVEQKKLVERLLKRGHTQDWIDNVLKSQKELEEYIPLANRCIDNSFDIEHTQEQIDNILSLLN